MTESTAPQTGEVSPVVITRLENGLEIVVIPDHRAPIVTHMVWYRNGSADDPPGKSGIAHFLEHLMFKGTAKHPAGHFSARLAELGGEENAFTSPDFTAYFQRVPREHLELCMAYEADRMQNIAPPDDIVATERDVVLEERRMRTDSDPGQILGEAMMAALYTAHPYGRPIIGWQHEIEAFDRRDALAYYRRFYTPENAILIVAGDVAPAEVVAIAQSAYGGIPPLGETPRRIRPQEPPPKTHRQVTFADERVGQAIYQRVHLVPSYATAETGQAEALQIVAYLLGASAIGALSKALVRDQKIAVEVGTYYMGTALDAGRFGLHAVPAPGVSLEQLDVAIDGVLAQLAETGFDADDLRRAKTRLIAESVFASDNQTVLAQRYGTALTTGLTRHDVEEGPRRIEAVSLADLGLALARLDRRGAVSGCLLPTAHAS